jgi:hypothetical protein
MPIVDVEADVLLLGVKPASERSNNTSNVCFDNRARGTRLAVTSTPCWKCQPKYVLQKELLVYPLWEPGAYGFTPLVGNIVY